MIYHLGDPESPQKEILVKNPWYRTPEQKEAEKNSPFFLTDEELNRICGECHSPTLPISLYSLAYCGVPLERKANDIKPGLWESINSIPAFEILDYPEDQVCFECIARLDKIRDKEGYRPVRDYLNHENECRCANWLLMRSGCQCEAGHEV